MHCGHFMPIYSAISALLQNTYLAGLNTGTKWQSGNGPE
jgi:hypothetical protein